MGLIRRGSSGQNDLRTFVPSDAESAPSSTKFKPEHLATHIEARLETVVSSIAEQRQIFKGADHAFLWKPKLRIPDILRERGQSAGLCEALHTCNCCNTEQEVLQAIQQLSQHGIKGWDPPQPTFYISFIRPSRAVQYRHRQWL